MSTRTSNLVAGTALLSLSVAVIALSRSFPKGRPGVPGPSFFPNLIAGALALLSMLLIVRTYLAADREDQPEATDPHCQQGSSRLVVATVAASLAYVAFVDRIGFMVTTFAFIAALLALYRIGTWLKITVMSALVTSSVYVVFARLLMVQLPAGILM